MKKKNILKGDLRFLVWEIWYDINRVSLVGGDYFEVWVLDIGLWVFVDYVVRDVELLYGFEFDEVGVEL